MWKKFIVVFILLCTIHFWNFYLVPGELLKYSILIIWVVFFGSFAIMYFPGEQMQFKNALLVLLIGIVLNILSARLNNQQGIRDTFIGFGYFYYILFYFFLHQLKISKEFLENLIIVFAFLYAIFYLYQEDIFPRIVFAGDMVKNRGTLRIRMEGNGFLMLGYFLLLNRYLMKQKLIHIFLALILIVVLLKGGFRTLIAGSILVSGIVFIKLVKHSPTNILLVLAAVIGLIFILQFSRYSYIIENMVNVTEQQQAEGETYIRRLQFDYFANEYPRNFSYYLVGGGLPAGYGSYSDYMASIVQNFGYYWVDLGLVGFYFVVGLVALIGILMYTGKAIFIKLQPEAFYLKAYFMYLFIVSLLTTMEIYRQGIFPVQAIALYLIDLAKKEMDKLPANTT